jgi:ABC-type polysaccharide/polyol phosphate export permease
VPAEYQALYRINPLVPLIEAYRDVFFGRSIVDKQGLLMVAMESIVLVTAGYLVFRAMRFRFAEEV